MMTGFTRWKNENTRPNAVSRQVVGIGSSKDVDHLAA